MSIIARYLSKILGRTICNLSSRNDGRYGIGGITTGKSTSLPRLLVDCLRSLR